MKEVWGDQFVQNCMATWAKRDCSKNTLYLFNLCNLLMLCCILRASRGHPVCALERCFLANMAPVKTRGSASLLTLCLWFNPYSYNSHFTIFFPSFFSPSQQPSGTFFCQPSFCSLPGAFQAAPLEESGLTVVTGKWVDFQLEKLWNITIHSFICYSLLLGHS